MYSDMVKWMGEKLWSVIPIEGRPRFLNDLKNNQDYVISIFKQDVEWLAISYTMTTCQIAILNADGDLSAEVSCAKAIVRYMCDELLKDELTKIPGDETLKTVRELPGPIFSATGTSKSCEPRPLVKNDRFNILGSGH